MITVQVNGVPAPQGSKRHVGNGRMVESSKAVGPWREAVRAETQRVMGERLPLDGAMCVLITFVLLRPKSAPKRQVYPVKRPDLDKLARSVLDGLTAGGAFADDSQVVALQTDKRYGPRPGATIRFGVYEEDR